jgi:hypothetical protein
VSFVVTALFIVFAVQIIMNVKVTGGTAKWIWNHIPDALKRRIEQVLPYVRKSGSSNKSTKGERDKEEKPRGSSIDTMRTQEDQKGDKEKLPAKKNEVKAKPDAEKHQLRRRLLFWKKKKDSEDEESGTAKPKESKLSTKVT